MKKQVRILPPSEKRVKIRKNVLFICVKRSTHAVVPLFTSNKHTKIRCSLLSCHQGTYIRHFGTFCAGEKHSIPDFGVLCPPEKQILRVCHADCTHKHLTAPVFGEHCMREIPFMQEFYNARAKELAGSEKPPTSESPSDFIKKHLKTVNKRLCNAGM
jgi:hypothetical protein